MMHAYFARMIDAFRPADGPPPRTLGAFFRWALSGAWPGLTLAAFASALSGAAEVASATLLGMLLASSCSDTGAQAQAFGRVGAVNQEATGTPPGVGMGRKPPVFLRPGQSMRLGIEGLGEQRQKVVAYDG